MSERVVAVAPTMGFATLVSTFRDYHHGMLPVVDPERRLLGVVSVSDLLPRLALNALPAQSVPVGVVCLCDLLNVLHRRDTDIRAEVRDIAQAPDIGADTASLAVGCLDGHVTLTAVTVRHSQADLLREPRARSRVSWMLPKTSAGRSKTHAPNTAFPCSDRTGRRCAGAVRPNPPGTRWAHAGREKGSAPATAQECAPDAYDGPEGMTDHAAPHRPGGHDDVSGPGRAGHWFP